MTEFIIHVFCLEQGLHKAIRVSQGLSPQEISSKVKEGSVLEKPRHSSRQLQLQKHSESIVALEREKDDINWLENDVKKAQCVENEWTYQDFERTVLSALPALTSKSSK